MSSLDTRDPLLETRAAWVRDRENAVAAERERCAKIAENYSNAKPGDICEVQAGDWQYAIAQAIRGIKS